MKINNLYAMMFLAGNAAVAPAQAETINTGSELLSAIRNNGAGNTASLTLGQDIVLDENGGNVSGIVVIDGTENNYAIDGQQHLGFALPSNTNNLTIQNATLKNFGGVNSNTGIINNNAGGTVTLKNVIIQDNTFQATHPGETYAASPAHINNAGEMSINGKFINNQSKSNNDARANGGIIANSGGHISNISGEFTNNNIERTYSGGSYIHGGILWVGGSAATSLVDNIDAVFTDNRAYTSNNSSYGSVLYVNTGKVGSINGTFTNNIALSGSADAAGGVIYNASNIDNISGIFKDNKAQSDGKLTFNKVYGGAIYANDSIAKLSNALFENNSAIGPKGKGGAIYLDGTTREPGKIEEIVNTSFKNNQAVNTAHKTDLAEGGAIYNGTGTLTIKANEGGTSEFTGNTVKQFDGTITSNAIYMAKDARNVDSVLALEATTGGRIIFNDGIDGDTDYSITVTGDETGRVAFNNKISNASEIVSENVTLGLGATENGQADLENVNLTLKSGTLDMQDDKMLTVKTGEFFSTADVKLNIDADLKAGEADKIEASSVAAGSEISLGSVNILEDGLESITVFANGNSPQFVNLDNFAAFSKDYKYTFSEGGSGILDVASQEQTLTGLNGAIKDNTETKSYSVAENDTVSGDLGKLEGSALTIEGNNNTLNGDGYAGMELGTGQEVTFNNVENVSGFDGTLGGVINNEGGTVNINNTDFTNNTGDKGGAIYTTGDVNITANGKDVLFAGNTSTADSQNNAIYVADKDAEINLTANSGKIRFEDGINGVDGYKITADGTAADNSGIEFAGKLENLGELQINTTTVKLADENLIDNANVTLNGGTLDLNNGKTGELNVADYKSNGGLLSIDVDPSAGKADELHIHGDASGHTKLLVHAEDASKPEQDILFAKVDGKVNDATFDVWRVYGSPYDWETSYNSDAQEWYLNTAKENPALAAEMMGYIGLQSAGFEVNRNLLSNVQNKVAANTLRQRYYRGGYTRNCIRHYKYSDVYVDENYRCDNVYNAWVSPIYSNVKVRDKADYNADIRGLEAGADLVSNLHNRFGFFLSFRNGDFDFTGNGDDYFANGSTDVDIDSYAAGLYYSYQMHNFWTWSSIYGSYLNVDLRTYDGVKADTDGYQFGSRFATGYNFYFTPGLTLSPVAALSYSLLHYDDFEDNAGKTVEYGDLSVLELELAARLEKQYNFNDRLLKLYIQPGIIRDMNFNNKVQISNFAKTKMPTDKTLGKMELGARLSLYQKWMMFVNTEHLFGSGYSNTSFRAGINYSW